MAELLVASSGHHQPPLSLSSSRRGSLALLAAFCCCSSSSPLVALANAAPSGFQLYRSTFDGYSVAYPQSWIQVKGTGVSSFFRNPSDPEENVSVDVSSPSSSRYLGIQDLGSPDDAAKQLLKQYLTEFMSTRLGVRRESSIVSASSRSGEGGQQYYEVEVSVKSFANNNQMAIRPEERVVQLEWSRHYLTVLGVENKRLYQLRIQAPEKSLQQDAPEFRKIMDSFRVAKLTPA